MAAFDKICSGYPQVDEILDHIRLGDNVVWQISELLEFRMFAEPFARQAVRDGRNVIYIRFVQHEPVLRDLSGIQVRRFDPDEGFEAFTVAIHEEITRQGKDAFYVFDCLSELQSVWYTDLMMGNFFRVTCPYLFELDTVAYFPLIRGRHSFDAVARIRDTTQLLLNVYSNEKYVYLHPLKVWNRSSQRMFLPHCCKRSTMDFTAVEDGVGMSRYYQVQQKCAGNSQDQNYDSHDRFFNLAKLQYAQGDFVVNLLQCRPLYQGQAGEKIDLEALKLKQVFFDIVNSSMGSSEKRSMDVLVQIDLVLYYRYPYQKKYTVAKAVERINDHYKGSGKNLLLMTPGRIGTSSPELGVPVTFRCISNFSAVCEVSDSRAGYMPELSYGSHMFQDLVEARILYGAVYNDRRTLCYHPELFKDLPDLFPRICPDCPELAGMIQVREVSGLFFWQDAVSNRAICGS